MNAFETLLNERRLKSLKKQARLLRLQIEGRFIGDAGAELSEYICPMTKEKKEFNRVMDDIAKIDSEAPAFRYEV